MKYGINQTTGAIDYIVKNATEANYISSSAENPMIEDHGQGYMKGFGSLYVTATNESGELFNGYIVADAITKDGFSYNGEAISASMTTESDGEKLRVVYRITNNTADKLTLGRVSVDIVNNNNYTEYHVSQRCLFDTHTLEHIFPCGKNGWAVVERLSGAGDLMYILPQNGTAFEHMCHTPETLVRKRPGIYNHSFYGIMQVFFASAGYLNEKQFAPMVEGTPTTAPELAAGQSITYELEIGFKADRKAFEDYMVECGRIVLHAEPGYIIPKDRVLRINARSKTPVTCKDETGESFRFTFAEPGEKTLVFTNGEFSVPAKVLVTELLDSLIIKRAAFVMRKQIYYNEEDILHHAIVPYCRKPFAGHQPPLCVREGSLWGTGSYEGGLCECGFVAMKNLIFPDLKEIELLDDYIEKYVHVYLQDPQNYKVCWFVKGECTFRSYNYIHLANFYHTMYKIARTYGVTRHDSERYLIWAYETLNTMFTESRAMDLTVGNMNQRVINEMLESMKYESRFPHSVWFNSMGVELLTKFERLCDDLFKGVPYAAECAYDNTGYDSVIRLADYCKRDDVIKELESVIRTVKGFQSAWWWNGSEYRWWDAETDFAMNCHHYTSPANAAGLLQEILVGKAEYSPEVMEIIYGGLLGAPAKIDADDGFCSMSYCPERESSIFGMHTTTGDSGLANYSFLKGIASVYNVTDGKMYMCEPIRDYLELECNATQRFALISADKTDWAETDAGALVRVWTKEDRITSFAVKMGLPGKARVKVRTQEPIIRMLIDGKPLRLELDEAGYCVGMLEVESAGIHRVMIEYR